MIQFNLTGKLVMKRQDDASSELRCHRHVQQGVEELLQLATCDVARCSLLTILLMTVIRF